MMPMLMKGAFWLVGGSLPCSLGRSPRRGLRGRVAAGIDRSPAPAPSGYHEPDSTETHGSVRIDGMQQPQEELDPFGTGKLPSGRHGLPREVVVRSQRERMVESMIAVVALKGYTETTV